MQTGLSALALGGAAKSTERMTLVVIKRGYLDISNIVRSKLDFTIHRFYARGTRSGKSNCQVEIGTSMSLAHLPILEKTTLIQMFPDGLVVRLFYVKLAGCKKISEIAKKYMERHKARRVGNMEPSRPLLELYPQHSGHRRYHSLTTNWHRSDGLQHLLWATYTDI